MCVLDCSTTHDENTDLYKKRYEEKYDVYDELYVRWLIKKHPDDVRSDWMKELQDSEKGSPTECDCNQYRCS